MLGAIRLGRMISKKPRHEWFSELLVRAPPPHRPARDERLAQQQLRHDAAGRPDVHPGGVLHLAAGLGLVQQQLRGAVPERADGVCHGAQRAAVLAGQAHVADLRSGAASNE